MTKREVHPTLRKVLDLDVALTNKFCSFCEQFLPLRSLVIHYKLLEWSCHGVPWLAGWLAFIYLAGSPSLYQMQVNLYLGILLDLVIVAVIKAIVRRRRPKLNVPDMKVTIGPDVFSFPSGHATRSVFVAYFLLSLWPVPLLMRPPLLAWSTSVCLSRVLLRRHHLLDVAAGVIVGIIEGWIICLLWLDQETSSWVVSFLVEDGSHGGEYHV